MAYYNSNRSQIQESPSHAQSVDNWIDHELINRNDSQIMSMPTEMTAAAAVADSKLPPGEEYEEIREQVRN